MSKKKIILGVLILLFSLLAVTAYAFNKYYKKNILKDDFKTIAADGVETTKNTDRINVLVLGMEHTRTDMIMVATFDPVSKTFNMISIPRDTFVQRPEYSNRYPDNTLKKINAVYEIPSKSVERLANTVSEILGIPIHDYVMIDYKLVGEVTDVVGGVDVEIPFNMYYDDPWSDPPLHVHFQKGPVHLDGKNAIEYLRWRENNDGSNSNEGDVGRVKRQQNFMQKVMEKALNPTVLPKVLDTIFKNAKTSLSLPEVMGLVTDVISMPKENIKFYQEVGEASYFYGLWYYINEADKTKALMQKIINNEIITEEDTKPSPEFQNAAATGRGASLVGGDDSYNSNYTGNSGNYNNTENSTNNSYTKKKRKTQNTDNIVVTTNESNSNNNPHSNEGKTQENIKSEVDDAIINNTVTDTLADAKSENAQNNTQPVQPAQPVKPEQPMQPTQQPPQNVENTVTPAPSNPQPTEDASDSPVF